MPDFADWLTDATVRGWDSSAAVRQLGQERLIAAKQVSITIYRDGIAQSPQTVRIEYLNSPSPANSPTASGSDSGVLIIGYRDHPTEPDTDIARGDWFWLNDVRYDVVQVLPGVAQLLLALAEASEYGI